MKMPRVKPMKMPLPASRAVKVGRAVASGPGAFAYHAPNKEEAGHSKMRRPHGGHGPRNPEE